MERRNNDVSSLNAEVFSPGFKAVSRLSWDLLIAALNMTSGSLASSIDLREIKITTLSEGSGSKEVDRSSHGSDGCFAVFHLLDASKILWVQCGTAVYWDVINVSAFTTIWRDELQDNLKPLLHLLPLSFTSMEPLWWICMLPVCETC